jgi:hypothetical protein
MIASDFSIRPAAVGDLEAVNRVLVETWRDTYEALIGLEKVAELSGKWHAIEVLARQLDVAGISFLVAERAGRLVGHALADARQETTIVLGRLYVLPDQ